MLTSAELRSYKKKSEPFNFQSFPSLSLPGVCTNVDYRKQLIITYIPSLQTTLVRVVSLWSNMNGQEMDRN